LRVRAIYNGTVGSVIGCAVRLVVLSAVIIIPAPLVVWQKMLEEYGIDKENVLSWAEIDLGSPYS